jgi:NAD(P) transhydrogenase subunit alpha
MKIGVPGETASDEARVALVPDVAGDLVEDGHEVHVAARVGDSADYTDEAYEDAGCTVSNRESVFDEAEIILQVRALGAMDDPDPDVYRDGQIVIGLLGPYDIGDETLDALAERNISAFSLELIPRISRARSMDALSSMAILGGYKAALVAAEELPKMFPLEMTAAGTIQPAEVFVIGAAWQD